MGFCVMNFLRVSSNSMRSLKMLQRPMYTRGIAIPSMDMPRVTGQVLTPSKLRCPKAWASACFVKGSILYGTELWHPSWATQAFGGAKCCTKVGHLCYGMGSTLMLLTHLIP